MPFDISIKKAKQNIRAIESSYEKSLVANQSLHALLNNVNANLETKATEMQTTIKLVKKNDIKSALSIVNMDDGLRAAAEINHAIDQLLSTTHQIIDTKVQVRNDNTFFVRCLVFVSSIIWLTLVVTVLKQVLKEMAAKEILKVHLKQELETSDKKIRDQNAFMRTLALDYQADVERERKILSSELHDELGSVFTAIKMDISWITKKLKEASLESGAQFNLKAEALSNIILERLQKTTLYINKGILFHRQVIESLNPLGSATLDIWTTLRNMITHTAERNNWKLTMELPDATPEINNTISLVVYRLVQETLNNANKYSKATAISVFIMMDDEFVKIEIADNGVGFDSSVQKEGIYGLSGMKNRVIAIGGRLDITSELGKGVITNALIPMHPVSNQVFELIN